MVTLYTGHSNIALSSDHGGGGGSGGDLVHCTQIIAIGHGITFEGIVGAQLLAAWSPDMR